LGTFLKELLVQRKKPILKRGEVPRNAGRCGKERSRACIKRGALVSKKETGFGGGGKKKLHLARGKESLFRGAGRKTKDGSEPGLGGLVGWEKREAKG